MPKKFIKITAACILTAIVLCAGGLQPQATAAVSNPTAVHEPVQQQAQRWVDDLAKQPSFAAWKNSTLSVSPIGPGTHSWLVLVMHNKETVGYLVINAVETGGYQLGEYGTNSHPLFDESTLSLATLRLELLQPAIQIETLYVHPLLAAWRITTEQDTYYADAASGEQLPAKKDDWITGSQTRLVNTGSLQSTQKAALLKHVTLPSFNPFEKLPWLTDKPLPISTSSYTSLFAKINSKKQLRYTAELFDGQMLSVWSVVGYNKWDNGKIYVALEVGEDSSERRYIPIPLLIELGHFYL